MFGCLRRIGCLVILLVIGVALWFTRSRWQSRVFGERAPTAVEWHAVTASEAERARTAVESLGRSSGPAYRDLSPEELGALLMSAAGGSLPPSVGSPELAIDGDKVRLRAKISLDDIKGLGDLGPLTKLMNREESFEATGSLGLVGPGLAEFRVESARLAQLDLPRAMIPKLLARLKRGDQPAGIADNAIPFRVPPYIGDVRVARGRVTLYKKV